MARRKAMTAEDFVAEHGVRVISFERHNEGLASPYAETEWWWATLDMDGVDAPITVDWYHEIGAKEALSPEEAIKGLADMAATMSWADGNALRLSDLRQAFDMDTSILPKDLASVKDGMLDRIREELSMLNKWMGEDRFQRLVALGSLLVDETGV